MYYVSCGYGTQSSLLAIWAARKDSRIMKYTNGEQVQTIFADTCVEHPLTYEWKNELTEYLKQFNYESVIVSRGDLITEFTEESQIPSRRFKVCTDKFKRRPIRQYWRSLGLKKVVTFIGMTIDEVHRVRISDVKWIENVYPFFDLGMTRQDCIKEIQSYGLSEPPKSGCYCCPYQQKREIKQLKSDYPILFDRVLQMEKKALKRNPKLYILSNIRLQDLDRMTNLEDFLEDVTPCSEYCMT